MKTLNEIKRQVEAQKSYIIELKEKEKEAIKNNDASMLIYQNMYFTAKIVLNALNSVLERVEENEKQIIDFDTNNLLNN